MDISLPPDLERFIEDQVASATHVTASDVVCQGLVLLKERTKQRARLKEQVAVGIEQLDRGERIPAAEVFRELREHSDRTTPKQ